MGLKHTCIDRTVVSTDRWFQEQVILRCQFENTLAMITNLKSVVRTPDPVQQIIKIRRKPPIPSCPWIFRHHWQVTELQQAKSLVTTYAATTHPVQAIKSRHCSLNFESPAVQSLKKNSAARPGCPGRTYFGQIFVINGEQSVVRELILWFWLVKLPEPHKQMWTYKKFARPSRLMTKCQQ